MTVRFGMVGTGAMAEAMLPAFQHETNAQLSALASSKLERAKSFAAKHQIAKAYGSLDALLGDEEIDAVYIANRTGDHAETSIAALSAGKHVLCEKPFALNADDGARVLDAARKSGKFFMEALWTHFLPAYQRAFEGVVGSAFGTPTHLVAGYGYPTSPAAKPRLFDPRDGGVLLDLGVYPISLAIRMFGDIDHLDAEIKRNDDGVDTHLHLKMRHVNGASSDLVASFDILASNAALIRGSEEQIRIPAPLFGAQKIIIEPAGANKPADHETPTGWQSKLAQNPLFRRLRSVILREGERHPYGANQYLPQMTHFVDAIEAGLSESDVVTHDLSLKVLKVLDQIRAQEGK